jgi:EAL domain-containing protein (putative c-di-GMP-specific phosphodiesterase class I)
MSRERRPTNLFGRRSLARGWPAARTVLDRAAIEPHGLDLHAELREHISARFGLRPRDAATTQRWAPPHDLRATSVIRMIETRYQPIVRMHDRVLVALEVLARLNHPAWGFLLPEMFIPEIENSGLSPQLTDVVTTRALTDLDAAFLARNNLSLAINLPLDVLLFPSAFDRMETQREWAGVEAERLTIELTESRPVVDLPGLNQAIERWRRAGYRLAIDDVAPNISNYLVLFKLPFSSVKLDKNIVHAAATSEAARAFLEGTVTVAHAEGLTVVAEGVEDEATWMRMGEIGVDEAQGYLIAQPLTSENVPTWLIDWQRRVSPAEPGPGPG